mmetsp:Transcript_133573/g.231651  ORF Transcript_133573/g.231651 Transcript_133573/m.231651 type:complete len:126 (-) Transcript_133573:2614-2991(-)
MVGDTPCLLVTPRNPDPSLSMLSATTGGDPLLVCMHLLLLLQFMNCVCPPAGTEWVGNAPGCRHWQDILWWLTLFSECRGWVLPRWYICKVSVPRCAIHVAVQSSSQTQSHASGHARYRNAVQAE